MQPFSRESFLNPFILRFAFNETIHFLPVFLLSVYFTIYVVLPQFIKEQNLFRALAKIFFLEIVICPLGYLLSQSFEKQYEPGSNQWAVLTLAITVCVSGQVIFTGAAVIIKTLKDYYLRQREHDMLAITNTGKKLQLLKISLHPRILFESLHIIYQDIETGGHYATEMILKLSDLLSYLLYEGQGKDVALDKELTMVQNYIDLKKLEHKNNLSANIGINHGPQPHQIAPGFLLPLLELHFHSLKKTEQIPELTIECKAVASALYFSATSTANGNQIMAMPSVRSTIDNIKRRLEYSNSRKSRLQVYSTADSLKIRLKLELDKPFDQANQTRPTEERLIYELA